MTETHESAENRRRVRVAQAAGRTESDPNSLAGQQQAMAEGDPVQLTGEELNAGIRQGTRATANESG